MHARFKDSLVQLLKEHRRDKTCLATIAIAVKEVSRDKQSFAEAE